jgi:hypothetical protein
MRSRFGEMGTAEWTRVSTRPDCMPLGGCLALAAGAVVAADAWP